MQRDLIKAAVLVALLAAPMARAQPTTAPSPAASGAASAPAWKQIYQNGQVSYYLDTRGLQNSGELGVTSLLEYKIPQVINGSQVWSMVTHMKLHCAENQMVTTDNTLYAREMGAGPVVASQPANDSWHAPQPGSLGGLIWSTACGRS